VVIDCSALIDIEYTALKMLTEAEERLRADGIMLWLAGLNPTVLEVVKRSRLGEDLANQRMFFNVQMAVESYQRSRSAEVT
jgi:SulP family sulfate permease